MRFLKKCLQSDVSVYTLVTSERIHIHKYIYNAIHFCTYVGSLVILALQFLTPYFYFIPDASLAAVIVCAVIFTVDFRIVLDMWRSKSKEKLHQICIPKGVN